MNEKKAEAAAMTALESLGLEGKPPVQTDIARSTPFPVPQAQAPAPPAPEIKSEILSEVSHIVNGIRRSAYGKPEHNFERIARFWQAYFENTGRGDVKITANDVSPLMRLMKEARLCETPDHYDSHVDIVGYTLTGAEVNKVTR